MYGKPLSRVGNPSTRGALLQLVARQQLYYIERNVRMLRGPLATSMFVMLVSNEDLQVKEI